MQHFPASPIEMIASLWRHRSLTRALIRRDVIGRYSGSFIGVLWSFFNPIFMLCVYTFVFSVVFQSRWGNSSSSKLEFSLILFIGLIVFTLFSECLNRAPRLIVDNVNYVKKVVFPLEILAWVSMGAALFHAMISLIVWAAAYCLFFGLPHITALYLPLVLLPLVLVSLGISWFFAALGVYIRDVNQIIGMLTTALLFLSPVFYPSSALPEEYRSLLQLNPLTSIIEQTRAILFWGVKPDLATLVIGIAVAAVVAWLGFACFQKVRKGFADVL